MTPCSAPILDINVEDRTHSSAPLTHGGYYRINIHQKVILHIRWVLNPNSSKTPEELLPECDLFSLGDGLDGLHLEHEPAFAWIDCVQKTPQCQSSALKLIADHWQQICTSVNSLRRNLPPIPTSAPLYLYPMPVGICDNPDAIAYKLACAYEQAWGAHHITNQVMSATLR